MRVFLFCLYSTISLANSAPPTPFPIFLKAGFSSVLEFNEPPVRVVLGDTQSFQVEKLEKSVIIRTLVAYASTNMFVYFKIQGPRLFVLTASEDSEPTYYKRFDPPLSLMRPSAITKTTSSLPSKRATTLKLLQFDKKKDFLTIEIEISADSSSVLKPKWDLVRLSFKQNTLTPMKLWAERKEIQKDSRVNARFVFAKPNLPRSLDGVALIVPLVGESQAINLPLKGRKI